MTITNSFGCFVILDDELEVFYPPLAEASFDVSTACTDLIFSCTAAEQVLMHGVDQMDSQVLCRTR